METTVETFLELVKGRRYLHRTSTRIHQLYHHGGVAHRDAQNDRALSGLRVATRPDFKSLCQ
jgi:hypothetical protein